jgi:hypothetical protein
MDQLNFDTLPPVHVTCDACGKEWSSTAAWYVNGREGCYQCFPDREPTRLDVARAAGKRNATAAADAATVAWRIEARIWLENYLLDHETLFVDDVWALGCPQPTERRAIGALISSLAKRGFIRKTGEYRPRTQGHGSPADVWKSLIYQGRRTA